VAKYAFGFDHEGTPANVIDLIRIRLPLIAIQGKVPDLAFADDIPNDLAIQLQELTGTLWAVVTGNDLRDAMVKALGLNRNFCEQRYKQGQTVRVVTGLAFCADHASDTLMEGDESVQVQRVSDHIIAVVLTDHRSRTWLRWDEDRDRWNKVSSDIERQLGGQWTSREYGAIQSLRRQGHGLG
jgi:hypothetical protein